MNKEEQLQELTQKIARYVPDIMELKFGCRLINKSNVVKLRVIKERFDSMVMVNDWDGWFDYNFINNHFEIIGRDITLEDVLIALRESQTNHIYTIDIFGNWECEKGLLKSEYNWDLGKQLHEQSEETITALNKLIK